MNKQTNLSFAALNPVLETNRVLPTEKEVSGQEYVMWGDKNKFPQYLYDLYLNVATLKSIVDTCVNYIGGKETTSDNAFIHGDELNELVKDVAKSYVIYGGFAINVLRNRLGQVSKLCAMDFKRIRTSKDGKYIYYSEDFDTKSYGRLKYQKIPAFDNDSKVASSVFYYKNDKYKTYPLPIYNAAITACELERSIDEYHLNNINNGFVGSVIVNLCNGVPDDEMKEEIERNFNEKFTGKENAGRVVISYSDDKDHGATIEKIETEDFSDRYQALAKRSQQAIFTSFRCTPTLCGIETDNKGFAKTDYDNQYELFYNNVIYPIQKVIVNKLCYITGSSITIEPLKIELT